MNCPLFRIFMLRFNFLLINFVCLFSKLRYIDEEGIEHLHLTTNDHRDNFAVASRSSRLHLTHPALLLLTTTVISQTDCSQLPATTITA